MTDYRFDVLYGVRAIKPTMACRITEPWYVRWSIRFWRGFWATVDYLYTALSWTLLVTVFAVVAYIAWGLLK